MCRKFPRRRKHYYRLTNGSLFVIHLPFFLYTFVFRNNNMNMKVLLINGSPRREGNTFLALSEVAKTLNECGVETDIEWIGVKAMHGCNACGVCKTSGQCVFRDELMERMEQKVTWCDGIIVGSPVYYAGPNGFLCAFLDRLFYSQGRHLRWRCAGVVGRVPPSTA